jgi:hypothetical protein
MAKEDAGAYIGFEKGHGLAVTETPEQIRQAISDASSADEPLIALTRRNGDQVLVNARLITTISLPRKGGVNFA